MGRESSVDALADTLAEVDRDALVHHSVRVLNRLAADRRTRFADDKGVFVVDRPPILRRRTQGEASRALKPAVSSAPTKSGGLTAWAS